MAALMYVTEPGYSAILFRQSFSDLALPGALMDRSMSWLVNTDAKWDGLQHMWRFPSRATLSFGYMQTEHDRFRYQSAEFQFIGFDELTQFPSRPYTYMFSRLRRLRGVTIPLRMRAASNPGGIGHAWVYERFIVPSGENSRVFIPAGLLDNPYIDAEEYIIGLNELDDVTKAQLLSGLWVTEESERPFLREWWRAKNRYHHDDTSVKQLVVGRWISWDTAFKDKQTSDYSSFTVVELLADYTLVIRRVDREKLTFPNLPEQILSIAGMFNYDDKLTGVIIEDAASGPSAFQTLQATAPLWLLDKLILHPVSGSKQERAKRAAVWCKRNCVKLPMPSSEVMWLAGFEQEMFNFPNVEHDDRVDSFTQAVLYLELYLAEGWRSRENVQ